MLCRYGAEPWMFSVAEYLSAPGGRKLVGRLSVATWAPPRDRHVGQNAIDSRRGSCGFPHKGSRLEYDARLGNPVIIVRSADAI